MRNTVPSGTDNFGASLDAALTERLLPRPQQLIDVEQEVARHRAPAGRIDRVIGRVHHGVIIASGCSACFAFGVVFGVVVLR